MSFEQMSFEQMSFEQMSFEQMSFEQMLQLHLKKSCHGKKKILA
jgi:hypothetical protein